MRVLSIAFYMFAAVFAVDANCEAADTEYRHLGVASCASSVCHGKLEAVTYRNVGLNEYRTWTHADPHARAYRTLQSPRSQRIARALDLPNATTAKICLDCHADNVAEDLRGPKFRLDDGVGCEACHGGSERWIQTHAAVSAKHADNLANGMYPLEQPADRARRCSSCHLGTRDRLATHRIMAAGHPRLSFELEGYTTRQPPHFSVDADYQQRKGKISRSDLWLAGQIENARTMLSLLQSPLFKSRAGYPEPAFYDCNGCHHPMQRYEWNAQRASIGLQPGALHLQVANLRVLQAITATLAPDELAKLTALSDALVRAGAQEVDAVAGAAGSVSKWLDEHRSKLQRPLSREQTAQLRKTLVGYAAAGKVADYSTAEQLFFGLESLSYALGDFTDKKAALDTLYATIDDSRNFSPQAFAAACHAARARF